MPQVDTRTAADRREYMRNYQQRRRLFRTSTLATVDARGVINGLALQYYDYNDGEIRRHYLRDGSGMMMWPERSRDFPETLEQTLARVR